jgi:hypothetical protein
VVTVRNPVIDVLTEAEAPSFSEVMSLLEPTKAYFQGFHSECRRVDTYYNVSYPIDAPEGYNAIPTPLGRAAIDTATDHVDVDNIAISVPPPSQRAKARAERLQKFYEGTWNNISRPVKRAAVRHAFSYGIGWMKTMWDTDRWPNAPHVEDFDSDGDYKEALEEFMEEREIRFPIVVENVNPKNLVWDVSRIGPKWAIEFYQINTRDVQNQYPQWAADQTSLVSDWVEYWDEKWFVFIAGNEQVAAGAHEYGYMPYVPIIPASAMDWDSGSPFDRYQSLLFGTYTLQDEHARLMTAYSAIVRNTAWRTLDFTGPEHQAEKARENYETFGGLNVVPAGVEVKTSPMVQVTPDLMNQISIIETMFEQATFPNVVRGIRPRGVSTGFGVSVLAGMGRLKFQGVASGMAKAIEQCNSRFAALIEHKAKGRLTVHARSEVHDFDQTIGPEDVKGLVENIVTLKAEAPEEREREAMLAVRLYQGLPGFSLQEALRRSGVPNPLEMITDRFSEDLLLSPATRAQAEALVAQRIGLLGQLGQLLGGGGDQGTNIGNQFLPGQQQLPDAANTLSQGARTGAFPQGFGGMDSQGGNIGGAPGSPQNIPSGQVI